MGGGAVVGGAVGGGGSVVAGVGKAVWSGWLSVGHRVGRQSVGRVSFGIVEAVRGGWGLSVVHVEAGLPQRMRSVARLRVRARVKVYGWALGARVWVWGLFVLWNMVGLVQVVGGGSGGGFLWVLCLIRIFRTPSPPPLTFAIRMGYNRG